MKKAFTLVVLMVTPTLAFAQGTVGFVNNTAGLVKQVSPVDFTLISVPVGGAQVELLAAPAGTPFTPFVGIGASGLVLNFTSLEGFLAGNPGWADIATTGIQGAAGRFNGGTVTLTNVAGGANAEYVIIGWTGNSATLDEAFRAGALVSWSPMLTTTTGRAGTPPIAATPLSATFTGITFGCLDGYFMGFTTQPTSQTVVLGATVTFYVGAMACPPPGYQWYFNGVSIPGANGSSFQISNAQVTNAGSYWVRLGNSRWAGPFGGGTVQVSASATLTVLAPPIITYPPQNQTAYVGSTVNFRASAGGSLPLAYEWYFNGSAISGAGSIDLQLTNAQPAQAGAYTVVVRNVAGAVTSAPAMLSVIPPVERRMAPALALLGQPGSILNLEIADTLDLSSPWVTFDSVTLTNSSQWYLDVSMPLPPQRFYRAWQTGGPSVIPTLSLFMVPAITMTGPVGSSVRVDYINQVGPTDAWEALDTVTLSNASQLYFDVSAPGQPQRLYRLDQVP